MDKAAVIIEVDKSALTLQRIANILGVPVERFYEKHSYVGSRRAELDELIQLFISLLPLESPQSQKRVSDLIWAEIDTSQG